MYERDEMEGTSRTLGVVLFVLLMVVAGVFFVGMVTTIAFLSYLFS